MPWSLRTSFFLFWGSNRSSFFSSGPVANFAKRNSPGPEEKKELRFDPQTKRKKFAMIKALFALFVSFFCKTTLYLCCPFLIVFCCSIEPKKAHFITRFPFKIGKKQNEKLSHITFQKRNSFSYWEFAEINNKARAKLSYFSFFASGNNKKQLPFLPLTK